jgi:prolipoprotein diacylglyceryl transferase
MTSASNILGWFYWDPPRTLFTLPYIHHPIAIYGVCFALGFILGYFILVYLFKQKISQFHHLAARDVESWPALIKILNSDKNAAIEMIRQKISKNMWQQLNQLQVRQEPTDFQKVEILQAVNQSIKEMNLNRSQLELLFPNALITAKQFGFLLTDRLTWFVVAGTVIGARLADVFFYDWPLYRDHLIDILKVWKGGLASHGGTVGILIGIVLYQKLILKNFREITTIDILDMMVIPASLAGTLIRIGNFFNQEILGPETMLPWGVVFGHPMDGSFPVPRHPAQLYEAIVYLSVFCLLWAVRNKGVFKQNPGTMSGVFFVLVFSSRFFIEFIKSPQSRVIDESFLQMGQYLSIPFILFGISLICLGSRLDRKLKSKFVIN